jgi:hypothetical protein
MQFEWSRRRRGWAVAGLLTFHLLLGNLAASNWSVTFDETLHLASGYAYWEFGDFRVQPTNGNLPQRWGTLPLWLAGVKYPSRDQAEWHRPTFLGMELGREMLYRSGNDPETLLAVSRFMTSLFDAALGLVIYFWSRALFGTRGGLFSLGLFAVSPIFLANGFVFTSDTASALWFLAATGTVWRALHILTPANLFWAGASTGALAVAKMSAPLLAPMVGLMIAVRLLAGRPWCIALTSRRRMLFGVRAQAAAATLLALVLAAATVFTIWACHNFRFEAMVDAVEGRDGFTNPWSEVLDGIGGAGTVIEAVRDRRMLPEAYLYGLAHTIKFARGRGAFLAGEYSLDGWWYYFPYCFLVKSGTFELLAGVASCAALVWAGIRKTPSRRRRAFYYAVPLAALWAVYWTTAMASSLNIGNRHLTPIYGPYLICCGAAVLWITSSRRVWRILPTALLIGATAETVAVYPNYIAYFNLFAGGSSQGYKLLTNSAVDWGQDAPALAEWVDRAHTDRPNERIFVHYFGLADLRHHGIGGEDFPSLHADDFDPRQPVCFMPGRYVVSATQLTSRAIVTEEELYAYEELKRRLFELSASHPISPRISPGSYPPEVAELWHELLVDLVGFQSKQLYRGLLYEARPSDWIGNSIVVYDVTAADLRRWMNSREAVPIDD